MGQEDQLRYLSTAPKPKKEGGRAKIGGFAEAVTRKNVSGKLPAGASIEGMEVQPTKVGVFFPHGPDLIRPSEPEKVFRKLRSAI